MKIHFHDPHADWRQPLLCVTHTDRPVERDRCALNSLTNRYADPHRLPPKQSFESLVHCRQHSPHLGEVTVWDVSQRSEREVKPRLIAHFRTETDKPQHAVWRDGRLWVLGTYTLDAYDENLERVASIEDPWLAGGHTIFPDAQGRLLAACSASDSVLVIDPREGTVVRALRLPESIYGANYPLSRDDSVVDHCIPNDLQLTHLNCAYPWQGGILVSTLIQGAVGWFDAHGEYRELTRGFVGCHGAKVDRRNNRIFFSDSCLGVIVFLDADGRLAERVLVGSSWLHDAEQIDGGLFAAAVSDRNLFSFVDVDRRETLCEVRCDDFGQSTQFLYYGH